MKKSTRDWLKRTWGYILLPVLYWGWFLVNMPYTWLAVLSFGSLGFFMFQAKVPCCAETRKGLYCRNNATGILGGCQIIEHKWQNLRLLIRRSTWESSRAGFSEKSKARRRLCRRWRARHQRSLRWGPWASTR